MEIDKQKQMNEKEYNEIDERKYKLLLKQKDEEVLIEYDECLLSSAHDAFWRKILRSKSWNPL